MANEAKTADATAQTNANTTANAVINVVAEEVIDIPTPAQRVVSLPSGGVITGDAIDNISFQDVKQYPAKKKDTVTPHTYANQDYFLFSYLGKNFTTRNKDFAEAHKAGDLYQVTLGERQQGDATYIELIGYQTNTQKRARRKFELEDSVVTFKIKQLSSFDPKTAPVAKEVVLDLLSSLND